MKTFLSSGLAGGLFAQIAGTAAGAGLVTVIRWMMGLGWKSEPVLVIGGLVGGVTFLFGSGVMRDWLDQALGKDVPAPDTIREAQGWQRYLGISYDHKVIGIQYFVLSLLLLYVGSSFAMVFRTKLLSPGNQLITLDTFNTLVGMHGMVLIVSILVGIAGIANYIVPLLVGARDMAFPRLNAFGFWVAVPGSVLLSCSLFLGGFDTGWTAYPPLSLKAPLGMQAFLMGVFFNGWSSILGALNLIVTILRNRTPGMNMFRMPILCWSVLATSILALTATQLIGLSFQLVMFERLLGMGFFSPDNGGDPLLFQHLFWFYSHPAVYIFVLPGLGVISELLPVFVRKPLFGYRWVAISSIGIAAVGFLVWGHHMFTSGMEEYLRVAFMYSTLLVAVPTGVKFFSWVATIWMGRIRLSTPMLYVLGAILVFLFGGLSGPPNGTVSTDLHLHDSYWIVGHFHQTMFGGYVFPLFAAVYFWFPKATGRMMSDRLGKLQFFILLPAFLLMSLSQMRIGLFGMRRRVGDYSADAFIQNGNILTSIGGFLIGVAVIIFTINLIYSLSKGKLAVANPWDSRSPEWLLPSPAPQHNYAAPLVVVGDPYDYGLPGSRYVELGAEDSN